MVFEGTRAFGSNGVLLFLSATPDGAEATTVDVLLTPGDPVNLSEASYRFTAYCRPCAADCALVGAPRLLCEHRQPAFAGRLYHLRVGLADALCELESRPPPRPLP